MRQIVLPRKVHEFGINRSHLDRMMSEASPLLKDHNTEQLQFCGFFPTEKSRRPMLLDDLSRGLFERNCVI
jgi:hypothetical protein